jgi:CTP:molybdopterin cytidylyltransferase MocA
MTGEILKANTARIECETRSSRTRSRYLLWRRENVELMPAGLAELVAEFFLNQRSKAAASTAANRAVREETLQAFTALGDAPDSIHGDLDELAAEAVVATAVIAPGVLFPRHQRARIEQRPITAGANLVDRNRLGVDEHNAWHALDAAGLVTVTAAEERVGIVVDVAVPAERPIRLNSMLETEQLPTGACDLS